jgi:hypothetical protein
MFRTVNSIAAMTMLFVTINGEAQQTAALPAFCQTMEKTKGMDIPPIPVLWVYLSNHFFVQSYAKELAGTSLVSQGSYSCTTSNLFSIRVRSAHPSFPPQLYYACAYGAPAAHEVQLLPVVSTGKWVSLFEANNASLIKSAELLVPEVQANVTVKDCNIGGGLPTGESICVTRFASADAATTVYCRMLRIEAQRRDDVLARDVEVADWARRLQELETRISTLEKK